MLVATQNAIYHRLLSLARAEEDREITAEMIGQVMEDFPVDDLAELRLIVGWVHDALYESASDSSASRYYDHQTDD